MKPKHTPGPWSVEKIDESPLEDIGGKSHSQTYIYSPEDQGVCVAVVQDSELDFGHNVEANANLIAAAPLMYELLRYIAEDMPHHPDALDDLFERVKPVLAKARGK